MSESNKTVKLVITSVIISAVVLGIFTVIFSLYMVPNLGITDSQIYSVLMKLFPIVIGLILIEVGIMIARRNRKIEKNEEDRLPENQYVDVSSNDPAKEVVREVVKEVPVEVIKEVEKEVPVEVIKEVVREIPVEVVKEVPVEVEKIVQTEAEPVIKEIVKEVPIEVVKEVVIEKPVEKIVEVEKTVEVPVESAYSAVQERSFDFRSALSEEIKNAKESGYSLSVCALKSADEQKITAEIGNTLNFTEDGITYVILPFYNKSEADSSMRAFNADCVEYNGQNEEKLISQAKKAAR
ncbi:MAG TPA: hypothetical protein IAB12_06605 [Candidatus Ornithospirochaeta avicola]|uniref:Uncharacterized protein n=1 Tax=Candidatus Ornithospirochaeta avicola TaxID=2840896 RepID=A0A9D1PTH0_9SPIO|nr:hypothetical protein [Candidatus Ornithospirochaeta avicola]